MAETLYTDDFTQRLNKQQSQSMAQTFLAQAHPTELALADAELRRMDTMSEDEKRQFIVETQRGSQLDLATMTAAAAGFFGAGRMLQSWFPYTMGGNLPTLPTVLGVAGFATAWFIKRRASFRYPLAIGAVTLALGGGSITGAKL